MQKLKYNFDNPDFWQNWFNDSAQRAQSDYLLNRGTVVRLPEHEAEAQRQFLAAIDPQKSDVVLDAGCGSGENISWLHGLVQHIEGVDFAEMTLHVGLGNFRAIEVEDLTKHKTDSEELIIDEKTSGLINRAHDRRKKVVGVGTTSIKGIETAVSISGMVKPYKGWSNKFIFPPYEFRVTDAMITNLHLPQSPMMMMTAAFTGYDFLMAAYKEAIAKKYKFFTYGDAMLIL